MALQILENNGTFHLQGILNATTSRAFMNHFEHLLTSFKDVTVNIDKVKKIDKKGVLALKTLYVNALRENKLFSVIGNGCKDIYNEFNHQQVA